MKNIIYSLEQFNLLPLSYLQFSDKVISGLCT